MFSIKYKLFLTLLLAIGGVVFISFSILRWNIDKNFVEYVTQQDQQDLVELTEPLKAFYKRTGNWHDLKKSPWMFHQILRQNQVSMNDSDRAQFAFVPDTSDFMQGGKARRKSKNRMPPTPDAMLDNRRLNGDQHKHRQPSSNRILPRHPQLRYALLDANENVLIGPIEANIDLPYKSIIDDGKTIGYLVKLPVKEVAELNQKYAEDQNETLWFTALIVVVIALLVSIPVTFHFMRPITQLTNGTRKLIQGDYDTQIALHSKDELAVLSTHFNTLAKTLKSNENSRKRWIADISA